jgi:Short C-terminal domain
MDSPARSRQRERVLPAGTLYDQSTDEREEIDMGMVRRRTRRRTALVVGGAAYAAGRAGRSGGGEEYPEDPPPAPPPPAEPTEPDPMEQVAELSKLHESGALTDEEFAAAKAKALGI